MVTQDETVFDLLILAEDAVDTLDRIPVITLSDVQRDMIEKRMNPNRPEEVEVMQCPHLYDLV